MNPTLAYVVIDKKPVYISQKIDAEIRKKFSDTHGAKASVMSIIANTKENKELKKETYKILERQYKDDPQSFVSDYVHFELLDKDAINNVWDLLYDYCHYLGYAFLTDIRSFTSKLKNDYEGDSYTFPMGKIFALDHFVKSYCWWWRFMSKKKGRTVRLIISADYVTRIVGTLDNFLLYTNNFVVRCNHEFQISPIDMQ